MRHRHVAELAAALRRAAGVEAAERRRRVGQLTQSLTAHHPQQRLARGRAVLAAHDRRLAAAMATRRHAAETRLREAAAHLHALSPLAVLGRGYAMCWSDDRTTLVRTAEAVTAGDRVHVRLASGELGCEVREVRRRRPRRLIRRRTPMDPTIKDFEAAIAELESVVKQLEAGDLALETSLALYERGVQLSRFCHARLDAADRRIEILNERGELTAAPPGLAEVSQDEDR